jgi:osmotically-inducible protein OsmY
MTRSPSLSILVLTLAFAHPPASAEEPESPPAAPPEAQTQTAPSPGPTPPETAAPAIEPPAKLSIPTDEEIVASVKETLQRDSDLTANADLVVKCEVGILTLGGRARTLAQLRQAERLAGTVRGVLDVVVTAAVTTRGAPDSQILMEAQRAFDIPSFSGDRIGVAVSEGRIRLDGTVISYARKLLAEKTASEIEGVTLILNSLKVVTAPEGNDEELAHRILLLLTGGLTPIPGEFEVTVKGGRALLKGHVPLYYLRQQAQRLAFSVGGVKEVDNRLTVDPAAPAP